MERPRNDSALLTAVAMLAAMFMIAQHIAAKAARDALFLTHFDVSQLPTLMMGSAALSVAAVLLTSRLLTVFGPARLIPPLYLISATLLILQWSLSTSMPRVTAVALYLHASALNSILISGFWSVVNERFDPYTAKQIIPKLTAATTFGGVVGGLGANAVASAADTNAILLMLGGMHLFCGLAVGILSRGQRQARTAEEAPGDLLAPLKSGSLILRMAVLTLFVSTTAGVLDYILKAQASTELSSGDLITFFSYFYTGVGLGTFLLQSALGKSALRWLGLGGTMAAWPLAILATGGFALMARSLVTITLLRGSANLLYNSFFRAGFELLYTPIAPADKRAGKVLIDVGAERSGDLLSGLLITVVLALGFATEGFLLVIAMALAVACLAFMAMLNRGYVSQLASNLRAGTLRAEDVEIVDATTARTIAETQTTIEREQLLREISDFRKTEPPARPVAPAAAPSAPSGSHDFVTEAIVELRSGDEGRIKRILTGGELAPSLLPHVIPLLADERVLQEALASVRRTASSAPGQLVDALLAPNQHPLVKRRLPLALSHADSPIALQGLTLGLRDLDWNARYRCARGLFAMRRLYPNRRPEEAPVRAAVEEEIAAIERAGPGARGDAVGRRIELLFSLFGALYEPETFELCLAAVQGSDPGLRGTALEYLENRLPTEVWQALRPHVARDAVQPGRRRTLQESARDLMASAPSLKAKRRGATDTPTGSDGLD